MEPLRWSRLEVFGKQIPDDAYLYFPTKEEQRVFLKDKPIRYIFFGTTEFEEFQSQKFKQFLDYLKENKLEIPSAKYYNKGRIILFLSGSKYVYKQAYEAILKNKEWRLSNLPAQITQKRKQVLDNGYIYVCGRDNRFRPIIVLKQKLLQENYLEDYLAASIYGFEYVVNNMLLPGQIQNWVFLHDLDGIGITDISIDTIKKVNNVMSSNYGGKLYRNYIVNAPYMVWAAWKIVKGFIDPVTVQKISIDSNTDSLKKLFEYCDKDQVQIKYGGTKPNITQYWPPNLHQPKIDKNILITERQYKKMYLDEKLINNFISPNLDKMPS